jgi:hypothetical protein
MRSASTIVTAGLIAPPLDGAGRDPNDPTSLDQTSTGRLRRIDGGQD